jgi:Tol biopolymer transport system component
VGLAPAAVDAGVDAGVAPSADCALGAFQAPEPLTGPEQGLDADAPLNLWSPSLSPDGLTLFFAVSVDGGDELIATATRQGGASAFSPGAPLGGVNSTGQDGTPLLSADGLSLYFFSTREGGLGRRDIWRAARPALAADFAAPTLVAGINGPDDDHLPWLSPDELTMLWETSRPGGVGGFDIWIARRAFRSDGFSNIAPLNGVNGASTDGRAVLSRDELTIYFTSERPDGMGRLDLWLATRSTRDDSFSQLTNLASLNSSGLDQDPFLSADERELMFASDRDGPMRLWRSVRVCE